MAERPGWARLGPAVALVGAVALTAILLWTRSDDGEDRAPTTTTTALAITSDAPRFASVSELAAASDLVVLGTARASERGRTFGEPDGAAIESRVVTIEVAEVLLGAAPIGGSVRLEEEGWLADGTPIVVDGLAPLAVGTRAVWFLHSVPGGEAPTSIVVSAQGRYLVDGDELTGVPGDDALVRDVEALGLDGLRVALADR